MPERLVVGWKLASLALYVASVRYRAMLPILELDKRGIENRVFSVPVASRLDDLDCLVIVKSFTTEDFVLACEARRRGIPVIVDLCDNIFIEGYGSKGGIQSSRPSLVFAQIARIASAITTTTDPLAQVVRKHVRRDCLVHVIPDGIETDELICAMEQRLQDIALAEKEGRLQRALRRFAVIKRKLYHLRHAEFGPLVQHAARIAVLTAAHRIGRYSKVRSKTTSAVSSPSPEVIQSGSASLDQRAAVGRIIWFGHHGADYACFGMLDLLLVKEDLEAIAKQFDVELVVVSNRRKKFEQFIRPFRMQTRYVEWSNSALLTEFSCATVALIPNSLDAFSICKSSNRAVLAILNGVPVVATRTPAMDALESVVLLDDVYKGLSTYLSDPIRSRTDVERGRTLIASLYGPQVIGSQWLDVINEARVRDVPQVLETEVAIVVQMALDWTLLRPLVAEMKRRGRGVIAMLNAELEKDLGLICAELDALGVQMLALAPAPDRRCFPPGVRVLLSASESNLLPHRFAHALCRMANSRGIVTATLQHGYETPGLTYHDSLQSARKVRFASQKVYLWSDRASLCPQVSLSTAKKCIPAGCPDIVGRSAPATSDRREHSRPLIGVFENLHWHRYPEKYRRFFMQGIRSLVRAFPDTDFVVHTHPAGRWIDASKLRSVIDAPNVMLAPAGEEMRDVLPRLNAVISSPSSVAVHAARYGLPVAVVRNGIETERYDGLFAILKKDDWSEYVRRVLDVAGNKALVLQAREFADEVIQSGDAAVRIVDDLLGTSEGKRT